MKYATIEGKLMEPLRKKWEDAKRTKLEYYIVNINHQYWIQYKAMGPIDCIQIYLVTNMSINSHRALTLL